VPAHANTWESLSPDINDPSYSREPKYTCNLQVYFGRQATVGIEMIFADIAS